MAIISYGQKNRNGIFKIYKIADKNTVSNTVNKIKRAKITAQKITVQKIRYTKRPVMER